MTMLRVFEKFYLSYVADSEIISIYCHIQTLSVINHDEILEH